MAAPADEVSARAQSPKAEGPIKPGPHANAIHPQKVLRCPSCDYAPIVISNGTSKIRTRVLIFTENGNVMGICPKCKAYLKLPIALTSRTSPKRDENTGKNTGA